MKVSHDYFHHHWSAGRDSHVFLLIFFNSHVEKQYHFHSNRVWLMTLLQSNFATFSNGTLCQSNGSSNWICYPLIIPTQRGPPQRQSKIYRDLWWIAATAGYLWILYRCFLFSWGQMKSYMLVLVWDSGFKLCSSQYIFALCLNDITAI